MKQLIKFTIIGLLLFPLGINAQRKVIKSKADYSILNSSIEKLFKMQKFSDSLRNNSEIVKKHSNDKMVEYLNNKWRKRDTLHMREIADNITFEQFFKKDARWKRNKRNKDKLEVFNSIFTDDEISHLRKQLMDNCFVWNSKRIEFKGRVVINDELKYTREEMRKLSKDKRDAELRKEYDLDNKITLYTFSKPIYTKNKKYALIVYNTARVSAINVFEKNNGKWKIKFSIGNYRFIDRIRP